MLSVSYRSKYRLTGDITLFYFLKYLEVENGEQMDDGVVADMNVSLV